jgi:hypothetical protein
MVKGGPPDIAGYPIDFYFQWCARFGFNWTAHPPPADAALKPNRSAFGKPLDASYYFCDRFYYISGLLQTLPAGGFG